jgi:hypothetical protein
MMRIEERKKNLMRLATVSILSVFACLPAFANARLPVVNVGAGSVSARAAFGERVPAPRVPAPVPVPVSAPVASVALATDSGEKIVSAGRADILTPRRPSDDLWAKIEKPLRLPEPTEISVIRSESDLPEEYIDAPQVASRAAVAPAAPAAVARTPELDAEIAKLVELQRKADESVRAVAPRPSSISSYDARPAVVARAAMPANEAPEASTSPRDVSVRRVVVPMEEEVIVRQVKNTHAEPKVAAVDSEKEMSKMSPGELKKAFKKTYLSENKHLSTYRMDDRFDTASELSSEIEGFTSTRDLSETGGVRPLEIKIGFRGDDSALSRDNYNLLSEYASIVVSNPKRAIQISISERATKSLDGRKLAARRLAIIEQVLRDTGVSDQRIVPVLTQRSDDGFVLRVISSDQYETISKQRRDMFGDTVDKKSYKSMTW